MCGALSRASLYCFSGLSCSWKRSGRRMVRIFSPPSRSPSSLAHVLTLASDEGLLDGGLKIRTMRLPDRFQEHDKPEKQYNEARLNAPHIVETVLKALRRNSVGIEEVRA